MTRKVLLLAIVLAAQPIIAEAQWAYISPPWTFNELGKYFGRDFHSIAINEWQQLVAFDSAAHCQRARLFAYKIRNLPVGYRESLLGLFAGGAEDQAQQNATGLIAYFTRLEKLYMEDPKLAPMVQDINSKVIIQWNASKCVPFSSINQ